MNRIAILASGSGTNAQAIIDATQRGELDAEVVVLASNQAEASALARAEAAGVATLFLPLANRRDPQGRAAFDLLLADGLEAFRPDLIVLAGWMLILPPGFLERFPNRIINVHPALLPDGEEPDVLSSRGRLPALRGPRVVRDALALQLPVTGATVHYVTDVVDAGPVILRQEVPIYPADDEPALHSRIKAVEHELLPRAAKIALAGVQWTEDRG